MRQRADEHSIPCSFDLLPNEIIQHIFELGCPGVDPNLPFVRSHNYPDFIWEYLASIQLVCRTWYSLCVSAPILWTTIALDVYRTLPHTSFQPNPAHNSLSILGLWLSRAKSLPTQVYLRMYVESDEDVEANQRFSAAASDLAQHSYHIETIHLYNPASTVWPVHSDWSSLRNLSLNYDSRCEPAEFQDLPIQFHIPALTHLQLIINSDWIRKTQQILKTINPTPLKEVYVEGMSLDEIFVFLGQCEKLQKLSLVVCWSWAVPSSNAIPPLSIPHIEIDSVADFRSFCHLFAETMTTLDITASPWRDELTVDSWVMPQFRSLTSASIYMSSVVAAGFVIDLLSASPNLISLRCTSGTALSFAALFSKLSSDLTKDRLSGSNTNFSREIHSFSTFRDLILRSRLPHTIHCYSNLREVLKACPELSVTIDTEIPSNPDQRAVYRGLQSLTKEYSGRFRLI